MRKLGRGGTEASFFSVAVGAFPPPILGEESLGKSKKGRGGRYLMPKCFPPSPPLSPTTGLFPPPPAASAAASICLPTPGGGRGKGALDVGRKRPTFFPHKLKTDPLLLSGTWFLPLVTTKHDFQKVFPLFRRRIYLAGHSAGSHLCAMVLSSPWFSALEVYTLLLFVILNVPYILPHFSTYCSRAVYGTCFSITVLPIR